ncbi:hypothetical protein D7D25_02930 [Proteiniphilum sp. X52]|nr:hypothetical protein D7D25_02930 [Proteiniphilum sp. X52]
MARKKAFKHKDDFGENIEGVERFVIAQLRRAKNMIPVKIETAVRTFILVPKDMTAERIERLKLKYKNNMEERK